MRVRALERTNGGGGHFRSIDRERQSNFLLVCVCVVEVCERAFRVCARARGVFWRSTAATAAASMNDGIFQLILGKMRTQAREHFRSHLAGLAGLEDAAPTLTRTTRTHALNNITDA